MILISSAAYVIKEFQAELGKIPPCFLPLGNKKLLEHQVTTIKNCFPDEKILLSLPESYNLTRSEKSLLSDLVSEYIFIPETFSLAESVSFALNVFSDNDSLGTESVRVLYGDTLIKNLSIVSTYTDVLGVARTRDSYDWKIEDYSSSEKPLVWCGYYSFSSRTFLLRCLALNRFNFIDAVEEYRRSTGLEIHEFDNWFDLGHVNTYFKSRAAITTQRAFNELEIKDGIVKKSGQPYMKILAEGNWFNSIPPRLKIYMPQLIELYVNKKEEYSSYRLEYLPIMPLNELFVHGKNTIDEWIRLFNLTQDFLDKCRAVIDIDANEKKLIQSDFVNLVKCKTFLRLNQFSESTKFNIHEKMAYGGVWLPSLENICQQCVNLALQQPDIFSVLHGDLCFSNMLYDSRASQIKVIDPRGLNLDGELTIYGDQKYDLAKLTHSVIGLYDYIIAGRYTLTENEESIEIYFDIDNRVLRIQEQFLGIDFIPGLKTRELMPLVVLLFVSMLPLHNDRPDRQKAMLANALRLYKEYLI